jgi:glycosyltransferase involved in cell wall biosynthesis
MAKLILIEGNNLFGDRTGIGQYTKRLLEGLFAVDMKNNYSIFAFIFIRSKLKLPIKPSANVNYRVIRLFPARVYRRLMRKGLAPGIEKILMLRGDIIIYPNFVSYPSGNKAKQILFVYDISFISHPQYAHKLNAQYLSEWVPKSITNADRIVTISESAKSEISDTFKVDKSQIEVIYPAVDHELFKKVPAGEVEQLKRRYGLKNKYILYTGTLEPRKNIVGILKAYEQLPASLKKTHSLVLAGGRGWNDEEIQDEIKRLQHGGETVICTGYVEDAQLPILYSGASVFVFPSHYEGFGIPPVEAMACGVPVITSNNSSLPESVGTAAITIESTDINELSSQIIKVLTDDKLSGRMRRDGLAQAKKFNWDKSARKLLGIIDNLD